ncbi:hypothetical protein ILUMI_26716 [Ignelater luminosus]|uniref:HTH psq-type domain-containing protein n=1 Tax=Ignelater luminosus TaxID=2038154 RepID=A0A8K0C3J3_IGNLU|nr:hypothetical protein ILUMI_26716 [Ignelater luminosus]
MVRTYKRKSTGDNISVEVFQRAAQAVQEEKIPMRDAAARYGVNFMTLNRYIRKSSAAENSNNVVIHYIEKYLRMIKRRNLLPMLHIRQNFITGLQLQTSASSYTNMLLPTTLPLVRCGNQVQCQEKPVLLTLDNHESHFSIPALNFCKSNGVVLLSFLPHTSHKLQLLERTMFGPLKRYFNNSTDGWLKSNLGRTMSVYDIPLEFGHTIEEFEDDEYLPSEVTNRPINESKHDLAKLYLVESNLTASKENDELRHLTPSPRSSTSAASSTPPLPSKVPQVYQTPEDVKPYPKAAARKITGFDMPPRYLLDFEMTTSAASVMVALSGRSVAHKEVCPYCRWLC